MIGTTFKLGFDGTSVAKGLGNVTKHLGKFGKEIGIGMARQVGARMTDTLGRILSAVPETLAETTDWAGGMVDMSHATGASVESLILLEEQFRMAGVAAKDGATWMSRMAANIQDAANNGGPTADALAKIGLSASDLVDLPLDKQFSKIGQALADLNKTTQTEVAFNDWTSPKFGKRIVETTTKLKDMESITADIFGGKMGYKFLPLFNDYNATVEQARNNVGKLAETMNKGGAAAIDTWGDALGRFENFKRSLGTIALDEIMRVTGGSGGVDRMFNFLDPEKIRPQVQAFVSMLGRNLEVLLSQDLTTSLGDFMRNLGRQFGEGIKENFGKMSLKDLFFSAPAGAPQASNTENPISELRRHTALLEDIRKNVGVPKFA